MSKLLALTAAGEAAAGLIVLLLPSPVVRLLFGAEIAGAGILMSRVAGTAPIGLGVACRPGGSGHRPGYGMLTYGALVTLYLVYVGISGESSGVLLWPAVVTHAVIIVLLAFVQSKEAAGTAGRTDG